MRIGLAQINTIVGDLRGNREKILEAYLRLCAEGAELVVFPELAVSGYPPRDLLLKRRFVPDAEETVLEIAARAGKVPALVGFPETNPVPVGRPFHNAAAWCENGEIRQICRKCLLPNYDVFDEDRYFASSRHPFIVPHAGKRIGVTICEDIWTMSPLPERVRYEEAPLQYLQGKGVDLLVNLSASPWYAGKRQIRRRLVAGVARFLEAPVVLCNAVGGNDELIFDGAGLATDAAGHLLAELPSFEETLQVVDIAHKAAAAPAPDDPPEIEEIRQALVLGLRDYALKSGFERALIGLSGGIDSAVTAALAVEALGAGNVIGISLPSAISSEHGKEDARQLAANLGIRFETLPIHGIVREAEKTLAPLFAGHEAGVTEENVQARARGLLLMAVSNKFHALLLTTGNKSEMAVGYCTLYGDMAGGLAVISDLPKTKVWRLARHLNRDGERIPLSSIEKPPSAELRPGQKDEDSLPPYGILDEILLRYIEWGESSRDIVRAGFAEEVVKEIVRKVDLNEYKRKQAPPGLKITPLAFGIGRRLPIVQRYVS